MVTMRKAHIALSHFVKRRFADDDYLELIESVLETAPYYMEFENSFEADHFREKYGQHFHIHQVDEYLFFIDKSEYLAAIILL